MKYNLGQGVLLLITIPVSAIRQEFCTFKLFNSKSFLFLFLNNNLQSTLENLEKEDKLVLGNNEKFSNEISLNQSLQCSVLGGINFVNLTFKNIDFTGSFFFKTIFKNSRFSNVTLRKSEFWNCTFLEWQIKESNLTRSEFNLSTFKNCDFLNSNLRANHFMDFEFRETIFKNSNLDLILVEDVKVWKFDKWIQIKNFSIFNQLKEQKIFYSYFQVDQNYYFFVFSQKSIDINFFSQLVDIIEELDFKQRERLSLRGFFLYTLEISQNGENYEILKTNLQPFFWRKIKNTISLLLKASRDNKTIQQNDSTLKTENSLQSPNLIFNDTKVNSDSEIKNKKTKPPIPENLSENSKIHFKDSETSEQ